MDMWTAFPFIPIKYYLFRLYIKDNTFSKQKNVKIMTIQKQLLKEFVENNFEIF